MTYDFQSHAERSSSIQIKQHEKATGKQKLAKNINQQNICYNLSVQHNLSYVKLISTT